MYCRDVISYLALPCTCIFSLGQIPSPHGGPSTCVFPFYPLVFPHFPISFSWLYLPFYSLSHLFLDFIIFTMSQNGKFYCSKFIMQVILFLSKFILFYCFFLLRLFRPPFLDYLLTPVESYFPVLSLADLLRIQIFLCYSFDFRGSERSTPPFPSPTFMTSPIVVSISFPSLPLYHFLSLCQLAPFNYYFYLLFLPPFQAIYFSEWSYMLSVLKAAGITLDGIRVSILHYFCFAYLIFFIHYLFPSICLLCVTLSYIFTLLLPSFFVFQYLHNIFLPQLLPNLTLLC